MQIFDVPGRHAMKYTADQLQQLHSRTDLDDVPAQVDYSIYDIIRGR